MDKRIVALIIAAIAIVGAGVAALLLTGGEEKKTDPDHVIASGDRVSVNYTGSYYGYVGDQNAAVFDTSYRTIAEDGSVFKSCDFSKRSEYEPLEFVVDDGKLLKKFNDAVVGHRVGDLVRVGLSAEEGYVAGVESGTLPTGGSTMPRSYYTTASIFGSLYRGVELAKDVPVRFTTSYGWPGTATLYENGIVTMVYDPAVGESYKVFDNSRTSAFYHVTSVGDDSISFDIEVRNPVHVDGKSIQMVRMEMGTKVLYITGIDGDGLHYKTGGERFNQPLYFEIEIVSVNS
ncbi:MAG: FKBP-type peptidyl-prolyl cis-trans isomerase [Candidatus Methanomethylophilaceae archaeon]|nr:FKBP-type peptidyl-prolyl cis-trans isomerase [Candidatus Methanomethylophilaceae archaeon]